jgi:carbamoyl-phosphate synthase large subunit
MAKRSFTLLVTGVGSTTGLGVIKALREQQEFAVRIVGTDTNPRAAIAGSSFCDEFFTIPRCDHDDYVPTIEKICHAEKVELLVPIVDPELLVIARNRERLAAAGTRAIVSDARTIETCNDKFATFEFFRWNDIPTPQTWLAAGVGDGNSLKYPLFVKPRNGVSSIDAFRVDSAVELAGARSRISNLVVQENLVGDEYTIDVMCDFSGCAFASVPRRRIETRSGISYKGRTVSDPMLSAWGAKIAEIARIRGPANVQCKVENGRPSFFEINPRFSGSLPLTVAAGVNSPLWILKLAAGLAPPTGLLPYRELAMARYWSEVFYPVE